MKVRCGLGWLICSTLMITALLLAGAASRADDKKENTAIKPVKKDENRHKQFLEVAKKGDVDVLFLGDSITDGWRGQEAWKTNFEPLKAANFGIGGDRTQHVLWRLQNGELDGIKPKAVVIMIGTNNLGSNTNEEIAEGIKAIVDEVRSKQAQAKILLLGIFPRGAKPTDGHRDKIKDINQRIAKLDDGQNIKYLDIGGKFLQDDVSISKDIMPDSLHLSKKGYQIWADAITPSLKEMLK